MLSSLQLQVSFTWPQVTMLKAVLQNYADALLYQNNAQLLPETKQEPEMSSMETAQASPAGNSNASQEGGPPSRSAAPAGPSACMAPVTATQQQLDANRSGSAGFSLVQPVSRRGLKLLNKNVSTWHAVICWQFVHALTPLQRYSLQQALESADWTSMLLLTVDFVALTLSKGEAWRKPQQKLGCDQGRPCFTKYHMLVQVQLYLLCCQCIPSRNYLVA